SRVHEMDAIHHTVPRYVRVAEADDIALTCTKLLGHSRKKFVAAFLCDVHGVERVIAMHEAHGRTGCMPAEWTDVDAKWQAAEKALRCVGRVGERPGVALVREHFLLSVLVATTTMLVVRRDGRVVVASDARNRRIANHRDDLVRPRS